MANLNLKTVEDFKVLYHNGNNMASLNPMLTDINYIFDNIGKTTIPNQDKKIEAILKVINTRVTFESTYSNRDNDWIKIVSTDNVPKENKNSIKRFRDHVQEKVQEKEQADIAELDNILFGDLDVTK